MTAPPIASYTVDLYFAKKEVVSADNVKSAILTCMVCMEDEKCDYVGTDFCWIKVFSSSGQVSQCLQISLTIPAACAGSERFFSALTRVITDDRCRLERSFAGKLVTSHLRNREVSYVRPQPIPNFGELMGHVKIEDWEDMYDSDFANSDDSRLQ